MRCLILVGTAVLAALSCRTFAVAADSPEPVIFWAHYMPMVPHGHLHAHPHAEGNHDAWPLDSQHLTTKEDYREDMEQALESGINGFQMLTAPNEDSFEAVRQIYAESGRMFYIAPQWLAPRDFEKSVKMIEDFATRHADDPHVYRRNGAQVHFFWNPGSENLILPLKDRLKKDGFNILIVPTFRIREIVSTKDWFRSSPWEGTQAWVHGEVEPGEATDITRQLKELPPGKMYFVPGIASGYDSSNRTGQAIHVPANGLRTLLNSLKLWEQNGFRQLMLVTWNDPQESLEIPSSRNIWGHNAILRYFHSRIETGTSPDTEPRFVASYPVEWQLGDTLPFQVLGLPGKSGAMEWRTKVTLIPYGPGSAQQPIELTAAAKPSDRETLLEMTTNANGLPKGVAALQPRISLERKLKTEKNWTAVYRDLPLPPITLRYNLVQFPVDYSIDLSKISTSPLPSLTVQDAKPLARCAVTLSATNNPVRRLLLCEGTRSLGAFRPEENPPTPQETPSATYRNIFVKMEASSEIPLTLSVTKGIIRDLYSPFRKLQDAVKKVEATTATFSSFPPGGEYKARVARVDMEKDSVLTLHAAQSPEADSIVVTLAALTNGPVSRQVLADHKKVTLSIGLTSDATDPNVDYPLSAATTITRDVPLYSAYEGLRVLSAWSVYDSGQVGVSAPVIVPFPGTDNPVPVQWIETNGTFDSFVDGTSETSLNPFTAAQVRRGVLPRSWIPYFHLPLNEGAGARLNDRGTSQQPGRAYVEFGKAKREQGQESEEGGKFRWIDAGRSGKALELGSGARIRFRSKSSPMGPETLSLWVHVRKNGAGTGPLWNQLQAVPFALTLQSNGEVLARFSRGGESVERSFSASWIEGWNHLAFVYDLSTVRVYINGTEVASADSVRPVYQRTHQSPTIGFSGSGTAALGFTGRIDDIQVIGTGLTNDAVKELASGSVWRPEKE